MDDSRLALYLMLGQTASKIMNETREVTDGKPLMISDSFDLAASLPESVNNANKAAEGYKIFFLI